MDINKKPEEYVGVNKRLLKKRLELDYSILEASIKLDITKRHLKLIEQGYVKVNKKLQKRFIHRYGLEENFFSQDEYLYPTPIEDEPLDKKEVHKTRKFIASWKYKLVTGILTLGAIACIASGLSLQPRYVNDRLSFYDNNVLSIRDTVHAKGTYHKDESLIYNTSSLHGDPFYSYTDESRRIINVGEEYFNPTIYSFEPSENVGSTFFTIEGSSASLLFGSNYLSFESRVDKGFVRVHFYESSNYLDMINGNYYHAVGDFNPANKTWKYNLIERYYNIIYNDESILKGSYAISNKEIEHYLVQADMEYYYSSSKTAFDSFMNDNFGVDYDAYESSLLTGNNVSESYGHMLEALLMSGLIAGTIFLALFVLSIIVSFRLDDKIATKLEDSNSCDGGNEKTTYSNLPKNRLFAPFIPECVIRILAIVVMLLSSLTLYSIYRNALNLDIGGVFEDIAFSSSISTLFTLSVILLFFIKLDINQSRKDSFKVNFILFFGGLLFYVFLLISKYSIQDSQTLANNITESAIDALPGNIVWGILSFSLLATFLFSNPKFRTKQKEKTILFRLGALIPLAYLAISSVYSIGSKVAGWKAPIQISSLLFSKSLMLIIFACLYCLFIFILRHFISKKYGHEKAQIYYNGNRFYFLKNIIVSLILVALAVVGIIVEKYWPNNPLGFNGGWLLLLCIPFVLFYHPHLGKRKKSLDILFIVTYGLSLLLGIILIMGEVGGAIGTL